MKFKLFSTAIICTLLLISCSSKDIQKISEKIPGIDLSSRSGAWKSENQEVKTVEVHAVGSDEDDAIKNASKMAIEKVVGMYVVSEEELENNKMIKDSILTHSNAYIKNFKINKRYIDDDGLYNIIGIAEVENRKLTKKLGELNVGKKDLGNEKFKSIAYSRFDQAQGARDIFEELMFLPLKEGRAYSIDITNFNPIEIYQGRLFFPRNYGKKQVEQKEILPFKILFKAPFSKEYMSGLINFLPKVADKKQTNIFEILTTNQNNKQQSHSILLGKMYIRSRYNKYRKKYDYSFKANAEKKFNIGPDKWETFKSLYEQMIQEYSPILEVTLIDKHGRPYNKALYTGQYGFEVDRKTDMVVSSDILVAHTQTTLFGPKKVTLKYNRSNIKDYFTGVIGKHQLFLYNDLTHYIVLYLDREMSKRINDIKMSLKWKKRR